LKIKSQSYFHSPLGIHKDYIDINIPFSLYIDVSWKHNIVLFFSLDTPIGKLEFFVCKDEYYKHLNSQKEE
jgi:hypothetical protein